MPSINDGLDERKSMNMVFVVTVSITGYLLFIFGHSDDLMWIDVYTLKYDCSYMHINWHISLMRQATEVDSTRNMTNQRDGAMKRDEKKNENKKTFGIAWYQFNLIKHSILYSTMIYSCYTLYAKRICISSSFVWQMYEPLIKRW